MALTGAGLLTFLSSFSIWASCSTVGCNSPLQAIDELSGIAFGYGGVTAVAGVLLSAIGIEAPARACISRFANLALVLALVVIGSVITFVVDVYVFDDRLISLWGPPWEMLSVRGIPSFGANVTLLGGLIALVASQRLRQANVNAVRSPRS